MVKRNRVFQRLGWLVPVYFIFLTGCMMPIVSGSQSDLPYQGTRVVVWGNHTGAVAEVVTNLQALKMKVVERAHLKQVFEEQKIILSDSSDDEVKILKVGKIVGAESIVFVDVQTQSDVVSSAAAYKYYASSQTATRYHMSVAVRSVNIETGEVTWSGTAHYQRGINNPEAGIIYLTRAAMIRAICPLEAWSDTTLNCDAKKAWGSGMYSLMVSQKKRHPGETACDNRIWAFVFSAAGWADGG